MSDPENESPSVAEIYHRLSTAEEAESGSDDTPAEVEALRRAVEASGVDPDELAEAAASQERDTAEESTADDADENGVGQWTAATADDGADDSEPSVAAGDASEAATDGEGEFAEPATDRPETDFEGRTEPTEVTTADDEQSGSAADEGATHSVTAGAASATGGGEAEPTTDDATAATEPSGGGAETEGAAGSSDPARNDGEDAGGDGSGNEGVAAELDGPSAETIRDGEAGTVERIVDPEVGRVVYTYGHAGAASVTTVPIEETEVGDEE